MKTLLILTFAIWSTGSFGQTPINKALEKDTSLKVIYANKEGNINKIAFFLNGQLVNQTLLETLNPNQIESINVVKDDIQIDNIQYSGQIHIKTKAGYIPKLISLNELKEKYTNLKDKLVVFMIDGNVIIADYDKYLVDESYLLTIIVDKIENTQEKIDLGLIKLLTRSDENIKKVKEIRIRGTEGALTK
ncbi:MAG: hypothetical protein ACJ75B_06675 [Flavisolibacter sp.]